MLAAALCVPAAGAAEAMKLFDGKTFKGWEGNLKFFRIEDGAVVGGTLNTKIPNNEFKKNDQILISAKNNKNIDSLIETINSYCNQKNIKLIFCLGPLKNQLDFKKKSRIRAQNTLKYVRIRIEN